jgi:putative heme-binding domain-containing protein
MRMCRVHWSSAFAVVAGMAASLIAQVPAPARVTATRNPFTGDPKAITQGAVLFRESCVFCHGVSARGGMRGPDLTTGNWTHGGSDAELAATITGGVAGTAMPPNPLTEDEVWQIVAYLRTLEQPTPPAIGDARRGETLFFGTQQRCSTCHIVNGRGGRLGPELTMVGSARSRAYLIESIREPGKRFTEIAMNTWPSTMKYDTVTAVAADGTNIVGVALNEDTFTVQVLDASERVHSLEKNTLKSFKHEDRSLMPAYAESRLNAADLDDLVAYLQTLRATKKGGSQ